MSEGNACANTPAQELDAPCRLHSTAFMAGLCREQGAGSRDSPGHSSPDTWKSYSHCDKCKVDLTFSRRGVLTLRTLWAWLLQTWQASNQPSVCIRISRLASLPVWAAWATCTGQQGIPPTEEEPCHLADTSRICPFFFGRFCPYGKLPGKDTRRTWKDKMHSSGWDVLTWNLSQSSDDHWVPATGRWTIFLVLVQGKVFLCSLGCPWTPDSLATASQGLGLQERATMPGQVGLWFQLTPLFPISSRPSWLFLILQPQPQSKACLLLKEFPGKGENGLPTDTFLILHLRWCVY